MLFRNSFFCRPPPARVSLPSAGRTPGSTVCKKEPQISHTFNLLFFSVYIDIGANSGDSATIQLAFNTPAGTTALARLWDVKVTQIECSNGNA